MSDPGIRRVLVALDAATEGAAALECAAGLAAALKAELSGLFIEDEDLLALCGMPLWEISRSGAKRQVQREILERELRAHARQFRSRVETAAVRRSVLWSFEVKRGRLREIVRGGVQAELVVLGGKRRPPAEPGRPPAPVVAVVGGDGQGELVLTVAALAARSLAAPLLVLLPYEDPAEAPGLRARAADWQRRGGPAQMVSLLPTARRDLAAALRTAAGQLLVLTETPPGEPGYEDLLRVAECDLVLVRYRV